MRPMPTSAHNLRSVGVYLLMSVVVGSFHSCSNDGSGKRIEATGDGYSLAMTAFESSASARKPVGWMLPVSGTCVPDAGNLTFTGATPISCSQSTKGVGDTAGSACTTTTITCTNGEWSTWLSTESLSIGDSTIMINQSGQNGIQTDPVTIYISKQNTYCDNPDLRDNSYAEGLAGGDRTNSSDPIRICTPYQLRQAGDNGPFAFGNYYQLANDIDLSTYGTSFDSLWPGSFFSGTFDGANFTIANWTVDFGVDDEVGLFETVGTLNSPILKNIVMRDIDITANGARVGAIVGIAGGHTSIQNCHVTRVTIINSSTSAFAYTGALVGYLSETFNGSTGSITSSSATDVSIRCAGDICGGFIGSAENSISDSSVTGRLVGRSTLGGFTGYVLDDAQITGSTANVRVSGITDGSGDIYGGFVGGHLDSGTGGSAITNCEAHGNVQGYQRVGGFAGLNDSAIHSSLSTGNVAATGTSPARVGGFIGAQMNPVGLDPAVTKSYSTGTVVAPDADGVGGFLGYYQTTGGGSANDIYATGNVTGDTRVGGLIGHVDDAGALITNCYSTGLVTGNSVTGGLIGQSNGIVSDCFWDVDTSGLGTDGLTVDSDGGTGKSTANMKLQSTFAYDGCIVGVDNPCWDFTTIWNAISGGYPTLR